MTKPPDPQTDPNAEPFTANSDDSFTADDSGYPEDFEIEGQSGPISEAELRAAEQDLFSG